MNENFYELKDNQAYYFTDEINRYYFTGLKTTDGNLIIKGNEKTLYIDSRYYSYAKEFLEGKCNVVLFKNYEDFFEALKNQGIDELFVDYTVMTVAEYEQILSHGFKVSDCTKELTVVKIIKSDKEIGYIQKACDIAFEAYQKTLPFIKEGVTEAYVRDVLEDNMKKLGASGTSFDTIVAFGKNAAVPHHETSDAKLENNQCILMDFGCKYKGYCSDITRMMFLGTPDDKFMTAYEAVLKANVTAEEKIEKGMTGIAADKIARDILDESGYKGLFTHSLGHGVGLYIHEFPRLSPKSGDTFNDGMCFTVEPGVYLDGEFGIRIEDSLYMKNGKAVRFFGDDKKLTILK
ncbi:MAG: aminopeptidase P family protein [Clostridia bacterium]|nr:aminopeptidase P family protein [Clostridia bacterium]